MKIQLPTAVFETDKILEEDLWKYPSSFDKHSCLLLSNSFSRTGCPKKNATDLINLSDEEVH